jgi:RNA polymerase sigma factor (sigma-70 family)
MTDCDHCRVGCQFQIGCFRRGDRAAGNRVCAALHGLVTSWVTKIVAHARRSDCKDIAQEVWIRILTNVDSWEGRAPFCSWAYVVTRKTTISWVKRNREFRRLPHDLDPPDLPPETSSAEIEECLEAVARTLPPAMRRLYEMWKSGLVRKDEMTWEEIGRSLGCCGKTARVRYETLMRVLARGFREQGWLDAPSRSKRPWFTAMAYDRPRA